MSGLLLRALRPLAKMGFATPVPDMPAVSSGQWIPRSVVRHGSIDHAIFLPLQELVFLGVVAVLRCDLCGCGDAAANRGQGWPQATAFGGA
jgi:hypothetical protein